MNLVLLQAYNTGATAAISKSIHNFCELRKLQLKRCINSIQGSNELMTGLIGCSKLETLDLSDNFIGANQIKVIASYLAHFTSLKNFHLDNNQMYDIGLEYLSSYFEHLHGLEVLTLEKNFICAKGCKALAANIHHCLQLKQLALFQNDDIDLESACEIIAGLGACTNLEVLALPSLSNFPQLNTHFTIQQKSLRRFLDEFASSSWQKSPFDQLLPG